MTQTAQAHPDLAPSAVVSLADIFRDSPAALVLTRLVDGEFLDVNRSYEALLGWHREELLGHTPFAFDVYSNSEARQDVVRQLRETGAVQDYRTQMRTKTGEMLQIVASMQVVQLAGEPCVFSVVVDINELHRTEQMLRRREAEQTFLAEASAVLMSSLDYEQTLRTVAELTVPYIADWCAVHILDSDGSVRELAVAHTDPARLELVRALQRRYPPDPNGPSAVLRVLRTGEPEIFAEITDEALVAGAQDDEHLALMRQLGFCSAMVVPLIARTNHLGTITVVSAESEQRFGDHDLSLIRELADRAAVAVDTARLFTERMVAEEAVRALNADLEQRVAERTRQLESSNRELESFAYAVSHDLRAPLRSVDGFSQLLLERYTEQIDETGKRYLAHVRDASQEMGELIDALLQLSRVARLDLHQERVDLSALARKILDGLQQMDPTREVETVIAERLIARGDARLLRIVLENLLGNAWKFTAKTFQPRIELGRGEHDGAPTCVIRDNGAGFDMAYAHKLFLPFQRLHGQRDFDGTGIGLATVQRILHRHGGEIWAEGAVGRGATITFTVPGLVQERP